MKLLIFLFVILFSYETTQQNCDPRDFGHDSVVCVCTSSYCDWLDPLPEVPVGFYYHLQSDRDGKRFEQAGTKRMPLNSSVSNDGLTLKIDREQKYQKMIGFGGSFTDAAGIQLRKLSPDLQDIFMEQHFGTRGLEYNLARTPIAGCDFSTRPYSYADVENDTELVHFALTEEDHDYKIPYIKKALELNPNIKLFASPWSGPKWIKSNGEFNGLGVLLPEFHQLWANYFIRFLEEYEKEGINFWAITTQNEPSAGLIPNFSWNAMGFNATGMLHFIKNYLGPTMETSPYKDVKIITLDDQRLFVVNWARIILSDPVAARYVSGLGLHWYMNFVPPSNLDIVAREFPDHFMLGTEACNGDLDWEDPVMLGDWGRGEKYAFDIIENTNYWVTGWIDWNLCLDMEGGPNWAINEVDAPVLVDGDINTFYKQPMYYALGHFTKYIPADSVRIFHEFSAETSLDVNTLIRPDGLVVVVILNREEENIPLTIDADGRGLIGIEVQARSIHTIVYNV